MTQSPILLGAHMSIAGGIENAYTSGASIHCTALQLFTHSNRQWSIKDLSTEAIQRVRQAQKKRELLIPWYMRVIYQYCIKRPRDQRKIKKDASYGAQALR